jgi:hypothetical protein
MRKNFVEMVSERLVSRDIPGDVTPDPPGPDLTRTTSAVVLCLVKGVLRAAGHMTVSHEKWMGTDCRK